MSDRFLICAWWAVFGLAALTAFPWFIKFLFWYFDWYLRWVMA